MGRTRDQIGISGFFPAFPGIRTVLIGTIWIILLSCACAESGDPGDWVPSVSLRGVTGQGVRGQGQLEVTVSLAPPEFHLNDFQLKLLKKSFSQRNFFNVTVFHTEVTSSEGSSAQFRFTDLKSDDYLVVVQALDPHPGDTQRCRCWVTSSPDSRRCKASCASVSSSWVTVDGGQRGTDADLYTDLELTVTSEGSGYDADLDPDIDPSARSDDEDYQKSESGDSEELYYDIHDMDEQHDASVTSVRCFLCRGDGITGCDVADMMADPEKHSFLCFGKCLNISDGPTAVYDCAHSMSSHIDACLENDGTRMCFCSHDYCNRPTDEYSRVVTSHRESPSDNEVILSLGEEISEYSGQDSHIDGRVPVDVETPAIETNLTENNKQINNEAEHHSDDDDFPYVFRTETDVIIPARSAGSNESEESSPSVQGENPLVGTLRDTSARGRAGRPQTFLPVLIYLMLAFCFIFSFHEPAFC